MRTTLKCGIPWPGIPVPLFNDSEFVEDAAAGLDKVCGSSCGIITSVGSEDPASPLLRLDAGCWSWSRVEDVQVTNFAQVSQVRTSFLLLSLFSAPVIRVSSR